MSVLPTQDQKMFLPSSDTKSGLLLGPPEYSESTVPVAIRPVLQSPPDSPGTPLKAAPPFRAQRSPTPPINTESSSGGKHSVGGQTPGDAKPRGSASTPGGPLKSEKSGGNKFARAVGAGVLTLIATPVVVAAAVLYGSGKLVEGIGKGVSMGPELVLKAYRDKKSEGENEETKK